jgi:hypothetical protein
VKQAEKAYNNKAKDMLGGKLQNKTVVEETKANKENPPV